ncbi:MAG: thiamine-phosphate kinase [Thermoanaerobaculia bacterium]|jgi:thiamine-monophosphate kinase
MTSERELLETIRAAFPEAAATLGIGDDAAILTLGAPGVFTKDVLVEEVDFFADADPRLLAEKCLAVNLSDLAAMGARPVAFLLALAMPDRFLPSFGAFVESLARAAAKHRVSLIGGDLSRSAQLSISVTAIGEAPARPLLRSAARPGDRIFVSRPLGGSSAGLELIRRGWRLDGERMAAAPSAVTASFEQRAFAQSALLQHLTPEPEIALGERLASIDAVHACIDISDGLSTDLGRLCEASSCGAVVEWERVPPLPGLASIGASLLGVDDAVLHGGEEFALLFTADARESELCAATGRPVYAIGRITREPGVLIERAGVRAPLPSRGFDHFGAR